MSEDKFEFISDEEIQQILGKQKDEDEKKLGDLDSIIDESDTKDNDEKMTDDMLEELLSYKNEKGKEEKVLEFEEEREEVQISPMQFREFVEDEPVSIDAAGLQLMYDVPIEVSVVLGSVHMELGKLSKMTVGTTIPLKKLAGEPVEIYVGDILVAKGETYVIDNENTFGVMITEILSEKERILSVYETLKKQKQI